MIASLFPMYVTQVTLLKTKNVILVSKITSNIRLSLAWWGHAVAQLVEALRYKSEGLGIDSRWCHWNFSLT